MGRLEEIARNVVLLAGAAFASIQAGRAYISQPPESRAERREGAPVAGAEPAGRGQAAEPAERESAGGAAEDAEGGMVYVGEKSLQEIIDNRVEPGRAAELMKWKESGIYVLDVRDDVIEHAIFDGVNRFFLQEFYRERGVDGPPYQPPSSTAHCFGMSRITGFFSSAAPLNEHHHTLRELLMKKGVIIRRNGGYDLSHPSALVGIPNNIIPDVHPDMGGLPRAIIAFHELCHAYGDTNEDYSAALQREADSLAPEEIAVWQGVTGQPCAELALEERQAYLMQVVLCPSSVAHLFWLLHNAVAREQSSSSEEQPVSRYVRINAQMFTAEAARGHTDYFFRQAAGLYGEVRSALPQDFLERTPEFVKFLND